MRGLALFNAPDQGQLRRLPSVGARRRRHAAALHRLHLRQPRRAAQPRARSATPIRPTSTSACASAPTSPARTDLCGAFKVPSLRNVALRQAFFHNGRFKTLEGRAHASTCSATPIRRSSIRSTADGAVAKFDDLPPEYRAQRQHQPRFPTTARLGDAPALSDAEIDDVIAFLQHAHRRLHALSAQRTLDQEHDSREKP